MTTPTSDQFKLTLEQRQKLGHVYLLILDWRLERDRKNAQKNESESQNTLPHSQPSSYIQDSSVEGEA